MHNLSKNMAIDKTEISGAHVPRLGFNFNKPIVIHLPNVSVTYSAKPSSQTPTQKEKKLEPANDPTVSSSVETPHKTPPIRHPESQPQPMTQSSPPPVKHVTQPSLSTKPQPGPSSQSLLLKNSRAETQRPISVKPSKLRIKKTPLRSGSQKRASFSLLKFIDNESAKFTNENPPPTTTKDTRISPQSEMEDQQFKTPPSSGEDTESTPTQRRRSARVAAKSQETTPATVRKLLSRKSMGTSILKKNQNKASTHKPISSFGYNTSMIVTMADRHKSFIKKVVDELKNWSEFARKRLSSS